MIALCKLNYYIFQPLVSGIEKLVVLSLSGRPIILFFSVIKNYRAAIHTFVHSFFNSFIVFLIRSFLY